MTLPERVGVYGGGRMGAGIAHAFLQSGAEVVVIESNREAAGRARANVEASITKANALGKLPRPASAVLAGLEISLAPGDLDGCGLIVEAVPEIPLLKREVLATAEQAAPGAWLATNTSSLSIADLGRALRAPERLIGLHFFNPVPASSLVEVVTTPATAPELVELASAWAEALGKTGITVTDSPGFASSRLGVAIALEAMRMLEEGVASAEDIDTAMTLGYRHPVGPLRTTDIVGLDVRLAIAEHLAKELGDRFAPPEVLRAKVAAGELGRKSGRGFYSW